MLWQAMAVTDVLCRPCLRAGKRRRLARFSLGRDDADGPTVLYEAGQHGPAQMGARWGAGFARGDSPILKGREPHWTQPGPKVHLLCGCGHDVQIRRERILAALNAGVSTVAL